MNSLTFKRLDFSVIGSEEARAASVCPQNRVYGSVHGSSCKANPLDLFLMIIGSKALQQCEKKLIIVG
jgi:hypothetical protein